MSEQSQAYQDAVEQFVMLWGDMASAWGINKTMAQIHALLYAEPEPLDTDTVMDILDISRGNANMNLHKLMEWELIQKVQLPGKRKDFYVAETDVWNVVSTIIRERQQREIAPIRENLVNVINSLADESGDTDIQEFKVRIQNYIEFLEMFERFTNALLPYINKNNLNFLKQLVKLVEIRDNVKEFTGKKLKQDE